MLDKVVKFYQLNLGTLWFICATKFLAIEFYPIAITLNCSNLRKEVDIRKSIFDLLNLIVLLSHQLVLYSADLC